MRCYVSGEKIGVTIDKEDLLNVFEKFGKISDCWVARQPPGMSTPGKFLRVSCHRDCYYFAPALVPFKGGLQTYFFTVSFFH